MSLNQIVAQRNFGMAAQRVVERGGRYVGVAVAVAANPLAHAQKAVNRLAAQFALQVGIQLGNFTQKSRFVVTQCVFNFICHRQFGKAQQAGLPQLHDAGLELRNVCRQLTRRQCVFGGSSRAFGMHRQRQRLDGVPRAQELGNVAFCVQYAFALHLGRVRGEYRRHKTVGQHVGYGFRSYSRPAQARQSHFYAAFLGVASTFVNSAAANVVAVFGQVGQVAEVSKSADHTDGLVAAEAFQKLFQSFIGFQIGVAPECNRQFAHLLDQLIGSAAFLFLDHIAQNSTQQTDVFYQRAFVVFGAFFVHDFEGSDGGYLPAISLQVPC